MWIGWSVGCLLDRERGKEKRRKDPESWWAEQTLLKVEGPVKSAQELGGQKLLKTGAANISCCLYYHSRSQLCGCKPLHPMPTSESFWKSSDGSEIYILEQEYVQTESPSKREPVQRKQKLRTRDALQNVSPAPPQTLPQAYTETTQRALHLPQITKRASRPIWSCPGLKKEGKPRWQLNWMRRMFSIELGT